MTHNVWRNHTAVFAAQNECATPLPKDQFLAAECAYQHAAKTVERTLLLVKLRFNIALSNE